MSQADMLPGSLHAERVRCGRPRCRCAHGATHGPYWYRRWWEHGRLRREYVRPADLSATAAAIARWREAHPPVWTLRQSLAELRQLCREWDS